MTSRTRTPGTPTELGEQCALFDWAERLQGRIPALAWLFHVPNGGARAKQTRRGKGGQVVTFSPEAQRLKASGVKPGVPDVLLYVEAANLVPQGEHGQFRMDPEVWALVDELGGFPVAIRLAKEAADQSFNCITVDGDTSTNDSFVVIATGASGCIIDSAPRGEEKASDHTPVMASFPK